MDLDNCGALLRLIQGMIVDDENLSRQSYREVEPGQNFLSTTHTVNHFAEANYESLLPDAGPYETWMDGGALTAAQRANAEWKSMLKSYQPPDLNADIRSDLHEFVAARKAMMKDEWY